MSRKQQRESSSSAVQGVVVIVAVVSVVLLLASVFDLDFDSSPPSRGSASDPASAHERALEAKLTMFINNTGGDGALFISAGSYVNDDIAHLIAAPGWRLLPRGQKLVVIDRMTTWWRSSTGKTNPSWFVHAPDGERIAGWSVYGGSFCKD